MVIFHIISHEYVPVIHDECLVIISLRALFVVACKNEEAVVIYESCGIGRIECRSKGIGCENRNRAKKDTYNVFEHNEPFCETILVSFDYAQNRLWPE